MDNPIPLDEKTQEDSSSGSKKVKLSITVPPLVYQRMYEFVEIDKLFSSNSEMATYALTMLITRLDMRYEYRLPGAYQKTPEHNKDLDKTKK